MKKFVLPGFVIIFFLALFFCFVLNDLNEKQIFHLKQQNFLLLELVLDQNTVIDSLKVALSNGYPIQFGEHQLVLIQDPVWKDVYVRCLIHNKNIVSLLPNGSIRIIGQSNWGEPIFPLVEDSKRCDFNANPQNC